jgi:hypothetical protein
MSLKRLLSIPVALSLMSALTAVSALAAVGPPTLTGEVFDTGQGGPLLVSTLSCNADTSGTVTWTNGGPATGPFPGTFTDSGTATFGPGVLTSLDQFNHPVTSVQSSFTIVSGSNTIAGTTTLVETIFDQFPDVASVLTGVDGVGACPSPSNTWPASIVSLNNLIYDATIDTGTAQYRDTGQSPTQFSTGNWIGGNFFREHFTSTRGNPTITTQATPSATAGETISDTATLLGTNAPIATVATGTINFSLFGPDNATCSGTPVFTSSKPVSGNGSYTSDAYSTASPGVYSWVAFYSGDFNNNTATTACNDSGESSTVAKARPTISTSATVSANIGGTISDTSTLSGGLAPTGTISFSLFGPNTGGCTSWTPLFTSSQLVNGDGNYKSSAFTPVLPGTYLWVASYNGDDNNNMATTACNDAGETSTVTSKASPTISTQATSSANTIGTISDTATLSGGNAPTGSITFNLFGPDTATCSGAPVFTSIKPVIGNGSYTSDPFNPFAPLHPGTYRWVASYSGDANNNAVTTTCNDLGETSAVTQANPNDLSTVVGQLLAAGCIDNAGIANALTAKLAAAQSAITAGNLKTAINILSAFIHQVQAQSGKHILASCTLAGVTFDPAAVLIADARSIIDSLTMTATPNPITGSVVTATSSGISGATVSLVDSSGKTLAIATTDVTGFYFFPTTGLLSTSGTYSISVTGLPAGFTSSSAAQIFTWTGSPVSLSLFTLT